MSDEERRACSGDVAEEVVLGVDTHLDFHVAVVLERLGRRLSEAKVPTTAEGYERVVRFGRRASVPCAAQV
jgi:transposase